MRAVAVVVTVLLALVSVARSDEATPEQKAKARDLYQRAIVHYRSGELEKAVAEFKDSYEAYPRAETLFNLAQTHRLLKNYEKAVFYYKQYLSSGEVPDADRTMIQARITDLENLMEQQRRAQTAPPVGPEPPSASPQQAPPAAAPPTETLVSPPPPPRRAWYKSPTGWALAGGGIAAAAIGAALVGVASAEHNDALAATTQGGFDSHHANSVHFQEGGWPLLGVGAVLVVAGATVFVLESRRHH